MHWKTTLIRMQDVLEEWGKLQKNWLYLQPIFSHSEIKSQMPKESRKFEIVDNIWRGIMSVRVKLNISSKQT